MFCCCTSCRLLASLDVCSACRLGGAGGQVTKGHFKKHKGQRCYTIDKMHCSLACSLPRLLIITCTLFLRSDRIISMKLLNQHSLYIPRSNPNGLFFAKYPTAGGVGLPIADSHTEANVVIPPMRTKRISWAREFGHCTAKPLTRRPKDYSRTAMDLSARHNDILRQLVPYHRTVNYVR